MTPRTIAGARCLRQKIAGPPAATPAALVEWMGAVQAQDYLGALWAVGLRVRGAMEANVEAALAQRTVVRTWPMRGTLHFVPPGDVRWMLRLLTPRVIALSAPRYRQLGLGDEDFRRAGRVLERALRGGPLTRPETYAALERGGVATGGQRGIHIVGHLAQRGQICFGPRRGRQPTFVLLEQWVPAAPEPTREEALARLATRYFASHGPATLQDFAWWSGLVVKDAQAAIAAAGREVLAEDAGGRRWWRGSGADRVPRTAVAALLPPWDEYLVAYRDRGAAVGHLPAGDARVRYAIGRPLVMVGGRVLGSWSRTLTADAVRVSFDFWARPRAREREAAIRAAERYARFLGKRLESS